MRDGVEGPGIRWAGYLSGSFAPRCQVLAEYREFCWGAHLPETRDGYGLLLGHDADGQVVTAMIEDVEYVRLLMSSTDVEVPAEKVLTTIPGWPNLTPSAVSVWSCGQHLVARC